MVELLAKLQNLRSDGTPLFKYKEKPRLDVSGHVLGIDVKLRFEAHRTSALLSAPKFVHYWVAKFEEEHGMVRHEAAEALGAIGSPDAMAVLREFSAHPEEILRESCWVALHMYDREAFLSAGVCV